MSEENQSKYIVAYMAGTENEGVTEDWEPVETMADAVWFINEMQKNHDFWKASICEIKDTYEN